MVENVDVLRLEERYERHKEVARELLLRKQQYNDEKIEEMIKASFFESREQFEHILFGEPSRDQVLQKLRRDILACGK